MKGTAQLLQVSPVMVHGCYHAGQFSGCKLVVYPFLLRCPVRRDLLGPTGDVEEFASTWANARAADPSEAVAECRAPATSANDAALALVSPGPLEARSSASIGRSSWTR